MEGGCSKTVPEADHMEEGSAETDPEADCVGSSGGAGEAGPEVDHMTWWMDVALQAVQDLEEPAGVLTSGGDGAGPDGTTTSSRDKSDGVENAGGDKPDSVEPLAEAKLHKIEL